MAVNLVPLRIEMLAQEVVDAQSSFIRGKGLFIKIEFIQGLPLLMGDRDLLIQVFNNLINNALKFTQEGGITVFISLQDEKDVLICIRDTGIGIAPQDRERLFEKFYQVGGGGRHVGGTGLGLAICKEIVQRHGGRIWAESDAGKGSSFNFTIPVKS